MKHLGITISQDGTHDAHIAQVIKQGCARVAGMTRLLKDPFLSIPVKRCLMLTALRPLLEYGAEVLTFTSVQSRCMEAVQLRAAKMLLGCSNLTSSEAVRGDLGCLRLLHAGDAAKLKWQHKISHMRGDRLEKVLSQQALPRPTAGLSGAS